MTSKKTRRSAFGEAASAELEARQLAQNDRAELTNKSAAYVSQTFTGEKPVSPGWANLVADVLKLTPKQRAKLHRAAAKDRGYEIDLGSYKSKD